MKITSFNHTVLAKALYISLGIGLSVGLVACDKSEYSKPATPADTPSEVDHSTMDHEGMNHENMDHSDMNHKNMSHEGMNHEDMNPTEPAEALGQDYSVYQAGGDWEDYDAKAVSLDDLKGKNQVVMLGYTSCQHTCPILVRGMKKIESQLTPEAHEQTEFLVVTLDTDRDTSVVMKNYAEHNEMGDNWHLIRSDAATTRMLANTLNIKYKIADNGDINHSNFLSILDKEGRLVAQEVGVADTGINPLIEYLNNQS